MPKYYQSRLLTIVILSVIFGLMGGVTGTIVARVYVLEEAFNIPFMGEIDFSRGDSGASSLIISNPKKVVVEQNMRVLETTAGVKNDIVGIFAYKPEAEKIKSVKATTTELSPPAYYELDKEIGQGFVITSDGWVIADFTPAGIKSVNSDDLARQKIFADYVMIGNDHKIYEVDDIIYDEELDYSFWHIKVSGFPVREFAPFEEIDNGENVIVTNWEGDVLLATISNYDNKDKKTVETSDVISDRFILSPVIGKNFGSGYIVGLSGKLIGLVNLDGQAKPINNYLSAINSLMKYKEIRRPVLGVDYIDLSSVASLDSRLPRKGALLVSVDGGVTLKQTGTRENSPAGLAGLMEGDIITSVNNIELDEKNTLNRVIGSRFWGEEVNITFLRGAEKGNVSVKLGLPEEESLDF